MFAKDWSPLGFDRFNATRDLPKLAKQHQLGSSKRLRVMCTLVKNEAAHIREWINFHRAYGWNKFVIYNDRSSDNLVEELSVFPPWEIDYVLVDWEVYRRVKHIQYDLQKQVYEMCFEKYWNTSEILTTTDVDEFLYPCPHLWESSNVFDAVMSSYREMYGKNPLFFRSSLPMTVEIECYKYGAHGLQDNPPLGSRTLDTYQYRARYPDDFGAPVHPPRVVQEACDVLKGIDASLDFCQSQGGKKHVYIPWSPAMDAGEGGPEMEARRRLQARSPMGMTPKNFWLRFRARAAQPIPVVTAPKPEWFHEWLPVLPSVHWFRGQSSHFVLQPLSNRAQPMCCNHYTMRSVNGVRAKGIKNKNHNESMWMRISNAQHPVWAFWDLVFDDAARRFYGMLKSNEDYVEL